MLAGRRAATCGVVLWNAGQPYRPLTEADGNTRLALVPHGLFLGRRDRWGKRKLRCAAARLTNPDLTSGRSIRMRSASTTWPATCGNGWRIAIIVTTAGRPRMVRCGRADIAVAVSPAAVPGPTLRGTSARPPATAPPLRNGTTLWASGLGGRLPVESLPFGSRAKPLSHF
jgi:hypothetical protein